MLQLYAQKKEKEKNVISNDFVCHAFNTINALNVLSLHLGRPSSKNIPACTSAFFSLSLSLPLLTLHREPRTRSSTISRETERERLRDIFYLLNTRARINALGVHSLPVRAPTLVRSCGARVYARVSDSLIASRTRGLVGPFMGMKVPDLRERDHLSIVGPA